MVDPVGASRALLGAVRTDRDPDGPRTRLADLQPGILEDALETRSAALAFWINVYNGFVQLLLEEDPGRWERTWLRRPIFTQDLVSVAGTDLSLDDVEHGILRNSMLGWGLGYLPRPFPSGFERRFRLAEPDPRIHFALNCGAASCPPITAYEPAEIDAQLDLATRSYLETEASYDPATGTVTTPRLCSWYRGDFGGKAGILAFLREYDVVPPDASPALSFRSYDWSLQLGRFRDGADPE